MGRGVVLHLLPGPEVVVTHRRTRFIADRVPAAEGGERGVGERLALGQEFLVDPYQVSLALGEQLDDLLLVRLGSTGPLQVWDIRDPRAKDLPDRGSRDPKRPRDLADAV